LKKIILNQIKEVGRLLTIDKKIVIVTHSNPDGDAIGSSLALYLFLKNQKFQVSVVTPNDYPLFLHWLPSNDEVLVYIHKKKQVKKIIEVADLIINLDFNDLKRIGEVGHLVEQSKALKIIIDHHPYPTDFADFTISTTTVSSTAELVYYFMEKTLGKKYINKDVASCIYTGIMTDTGCFSFNSSNSQTFKIVAELQKIGINKDQIYSDVYDNYSEYRMKLLGYCLDKKMILLPEYQAAYISLTKEELEKYHFAPGDSEGFVNYPLSIKNIIFTAIFIERKDYIKVSLRSKGDFQVNQIAMDCYNGGGHKNAAGGEIKASLDDAINIFTKAAPFYYQNHQKNNIKKHND